MTIKEFMNRQELSPEEQKAFKELAYSFEIPFALSLLVLFGPHIYNIMNEVL